MKCRWLICACAHVKCPCGKTEPEMLIFSLPARSWKQTSTAEMSSKYLSQACSKRPPPGENVEGSASLFLGDLKSIGSLTVPRLVRHGTVTFGVIQEVY